MKVAVGSILFGYTDGRSELEADGATLDELLRALDSQHPGLRFRIVDEQDRIRPHVKIFADGNLARALEQALDGVREVQILGALSGG